MEAYFNYHQLSIKHSKDYIKGRYIKTDQFIKKGTVIITSHPLGTVSLPQSIHEFCNYCFKKQTSPPLQRCSQCKNFCDMACFKNAWLSYHQFICKKPTILHRDAQDDMDLEMLERVALNVSRYRKNTTQKASPANNAEEESVQATMEAFFSLMGHDQSQQHHVKENHTLIASEALTKAFMKDTAIDQSELAHFLYVFRSNNISITDINLTAIGEGIYPIASLFNHSCRPNAVIMFDGVLASIQAIQDITPGTEITIAYIDVAHDRDTRQQLLREKYFFTCQCERCRPSSNEKHYYISLIDTLLGQQQQEFPPYSKIKESLAKEVEAWDLLQMCRLYDRKNDGCPDPNQPLTLASYTHYFIQFFAPYLLTCDQLALHEQASRGNKFKTSLSDFDDPIPSQAQPRVQATYDAIMSTAVDKMLSYPTGDAASTRIPYRLSTLSHCTRLFYDEIDEGHWRNAVKLGMYMLIQYCLIYPPYHPVVAKHYLTLAKACWNSVVLSELITEDLTLEKVYERGVRRWIMSSKETVAVAYGTHSTLWRETLELEWIFLREQKLK